MLLGARTAMMAGGWRNPYVTDGLVAMWDAEWNAGPGRHSSDLVLTDLVSGVVAAIPSTGYTLGANYIDAEAGKSFELGTISTASPTGWWALESIGCCKERPTNSSHTSGMFTIRGIGGLYMWRYQGTCSGVVGGSVCFSADGKLHYFGAPSNSTTASSEANNETFGRLRHRAATFTPAAPVSSPGITYYYNGNAKAGTCTMSYTDNAPTTNLGQVTTPAATSCALRYSRLAIYNRALTAAEIAANYAVDAERFGLATS